MSQKLSVRKLTAKAGIEASIIEDFDNAKRDIRLMSLIKIARGLDTTLEDLVRDPETTP